MYLLWSLIEKNYDRIKLACNHSSIIWKNFLFWKLFLQFCFEVPTLKQAIHIKITPFSIHERYLESVNPQTFIAVHWCQLVYEKKVRNLLDTYFQSIRLTKGPRMCTVQFFTYAFRVKGATNFRSCRVRIYLRTCRRDFINCSTQPAHSFWHVTPRCFPLMIAYVTINYNVRKHIDQYARITSSEK